ncbi:MAG: RidA family protein [Saprospiraceae bacterium]
MKNSKSKVIQGVATPRGKFPHYKKVGDFIYVSGTSSRNADNTFKGVQVDNFGTTNLNIKQQTSAVLDNISNILQEAGSSLSDVIDITTFLVNMNDFGGYNEIYSTYFDYTGPTRTTVAVHQLPHPHLLIEIKAVAYCGK